MNEGPNSVTRAMAVGSGDLPIDVRLKLADLAGVLDENRREFCDLIQLPVRLVWQMDRRVLGTKEGPALKRAAKAARALHQAFTNLPSDDREWVERLRAIVPEYQHFLPELPRTVSLLEHLFSIAAGEAPLHDPSPLQKKGRRQGVVENLPFLELVRWLFTLADEYGEGFTFDKNYEKGTLIDALKLLAPHLPKGVLRKKIPWGAIQRIKTNRSYYTGYPGIYSFDAD